ncbi:hypothetical protein [Streptomyces sp. NPDC058486]|uniref:hypothetical protein n=1 Tax=unclassified Streptomyces TaxID=2593676 RepID=UPI00364D15D9
MKIVFHPVRHGFVPENGVFLHRVEGGSLHDLGRYDTVSAARALPDAPSPGPGGGAAVRP